MSPLMRAISLGCPKNLADSEEALAAFRARGYELSGATDGAADAVFLNTCAFLKSSIAESEAEIRRLLALKRSGKIRAVVVAGCLVQRLGLDALLRKYPGVDVFAGIGAVSDSPELLERGESACPKLPTSLCAPAGRLRLTLRHSAYLKIADGCDNRCSYCAIPSIRGRLRSKPVAAVLTEARALAASGVRELVLIAQDTTAYGGDLPGKPTLELLLRKLRDVRGVGWIRVLYARPEKITPGLARLLGSGGKICKYLDMPLQHCDDAVLKGMNRRYGYSLILEKLALLRRHCPEIALRTTFITGFPGETKAAFSALERFVHEADFAASVVFPYSREPGTPAAALRGTVPSKEARNRARKLVRAQSLVTDRHNACLPGRVFEVLMDTPRFGRTYMDAPDIDGYVEVSGTRTLKPGEFVKVRIKSARGYARKGELCE